MNDQIMKDWHNDQGVIITAAHCITKRGVSRCSNECYGLCWSEIQLQTIIWSSYPEVDYSVFKKYDWSEFYWDAKEAIPMNAPEFQGKEVDIHMFMDSDHSGDEGSCRSWSGFLIYVNIALVQWFPEKQSTIETSVFGTEFITMKQGIDKLRGLRYNLRMIGIYSLIGSLVYLWRQYVSGQWNNQTGVSTQKERQLNLISHSPWISHYECILSGTYTQHWECQWPNDKSPLLAKKEIYLVSNIWCNIYDDY